jgi:hypothetical protein
MCGQLSQQTRHNGIAFVTKGNVFTAKCEDCLFGHLQLPLQKTGSSLCSLQSASGRNAKELSFFYHPSLFTICSSTFSKLVEGS